MPNQHATNKRLAKNTSLLYLRMFFLMAVNLYASRVILQALGVVDYGIYNVVGGVAAMAGFMSGSLGGTTSRFITFELGRGADNQLATVFRSAMTIHYALALLLLLLAETLGLWFVSCRLVIPPDRLHAALWVYQCSVALFLLSVLNAPFNALIIAHERMGTFAAISIFEAVGKLGVALLVGAISLHRLPRYAALVLCVYAVVCLFYYTYCRRHFPEASPRWLWHRDFSKRMLRFTGWTLNGNLAVVGYTQGLNILLNLFFGPTVNAARGIASQVQFAISRFSTNFQTAVRPQLTKSYAQGDLAHVHQLVLSSSRYSFYLLLLVAFPLLVNTPYAIRLWLGEVPAHTVAFSRLLILVCLLEAFKGPTLMAIHATGDLKKFQIAEGTLLLTIVPIAYVLLKLAHIAPESVFLVYLAVEAVTQLVRVYIVYPRILLSPSRYWLDVLRPSAVVSLPLLLLGWGLHAYYPAESLGAMLLSCAFCVTAAALSLYALGLKAPERKLIHRFIGRILRTQRA